MRKIKLIFYFIVTLLCAIFLVMNAIDMKIAEHVGNYARATYNLIWAMINIVLLATFAAFIQSERKKPCK